MKKTFFAISLVLITVHVCAQEQFFRSKGGMSLFYASGLEKGDTTFSVGIGFTFKPGISIGIASTQLGEQTKPLLMAGFYSQPKDLNRYIRGGATVSYSGSSFVTMWGLNGQISQMLNAQKNFPTSLDLGMSILNVSFKKQDNYLIDIQDEMLPVLSAGISQALAANGIVTPFFSIGISHELNHSITSYSFAIGLNLNFDGSHRKD